MTDRHSQTDRETVRKHQRQKEREGWMEGENSELKW